MHGSSFNGDTVHALHALAGLYDGWHREAAAMSYAKVGS
jgi:hypothetical protein